MAVDIAKPDTHNREYAFLELENGLKVIIGSEPECDKAGAALCVNVGMCHERKDLPGLAHFLEHMLFTGTNKYPKEGEYHEFIQQNGGSANAYTTCYFTNYMFEIKPEMLSGAIDRFSRFFSEPLLTRDCTDREINAVDSEFQGGFTEPWWRYVGIMHQSANPDHPFHVAVGNNKVLKDEPKERGIDLYDEMKKLFDDCYSANGMTLCIFGKESVAEMSAMVKELFSGIPNKNVTMPIGAAVSDKPAFLPQDWNRLLLQNPVKDVKDLTFSWVLPYQAPSWKAKPTQYVSHLLGYEGEGSVIAVLKQKGLISACSAGDGGWLEGAFSLINVSFDLTDKGLEHI
jgi:insulysin